MVLHTNHIIVYDDTLTRRFLYQKALQAVHGQVDAAWSVDEFIAHTLKGSIGVLSLPANSLAKHMLIQRVLPHAPSGLFIVDDGMYDHHAYDSARILGHCRRQDVSLQAFAHLVRDQLRSAGANL